VVLDASGALLAEAIPLIAPFGRVAVIVSHGDGNVNVPVRDLYRRAGSIVGVNSLLYSAQECAKILARLGPAFDAEALAPPAGIEERPLNFGLDTYVDLHRGVRRKFVFVA
jgi:NADPH:quinone reductase-like Zn-dependent oxidoreductase